MTQPLDPVVVVLGLLPLVLAVAEVLPLVVSREPLPDLGGFRPRWDGGNEIGGASLWVLRDRP